MTTENWIDLNDIQAVAIAQSEGWEIEMQTDPGNDKYCPWGSWGQQYWHSGYLYRGRPRQPKMKEVKILAYFSANYKALAWYAETESVPAFWVRQPHLDMIAKVPE